MENRLTAEEFLKKHKIENIELIGTVFTPDNKFFSQRFKMSQFMELYAKEKAIFILDELLSDFEIDDDPNSEYVDDPIMWKVVGIDSKRYTSEEIYDQFNQQEK